MATTDEQYIQKIYDSQKQSALNTLKSAYDNNVSSVDAAKQTTDSTAYDAKREAAGNAAITRQRLNETFAANGLNTGAVGQANLALLNQRSANLKDIEAQRLAAQAEYDRQKAQLTQAYQTEVKNAVLDNDAARAEALYNLYKQQTSRARSYSGGGSSASGLFSDDGIADSQSGDISSSGGSSASTRDAEINAAQKILFAMKDNGSITDTEYLLASANLPFVGAQAAAKAKRASRS